MEEADFLALPEEQRKAIQQQLASQGLYSGPIDGKSGVGTRTALQALKRLQATQAQQQSQADLRKQELELEQQRLENERSAREAEATQRQQDIQRQQEKEESANPWLEQFGPFGTGFVGGAVYGELANRGLNTFERGNTQAMREIADELGPTSDLTSSQLNRARAVGAANAAERFTPSGANRLMNVTGRALSYGIPAAAIYNEYHNYQTRADKAKTDTERVANQQIANALLGGATGLGVEGGRRFFFPNREPGIGQAQMRIETARDLARRMDAADAARASAPAPQASPPPSEPAPQSRRQNLPGSRQDLLDQARRYGVKGRSKMTTTELREAVSNAVRQSPAPRGGAAVKMLKSPAFAPIVAGTVAAQSLLSDANAQDGSVSNSDLSRAAVTGGATGGAVYGTNKLLQMLPRGTGAMFGEAMAPSAIDAMTGSTPHDLDQIKELWTDILPDRLLGGNWKEYNDKRTVPLRNPMFHNLSPDNPNPRISYDQQLPGMIHGGDDFDAQLAEISSLMSQFDVPEPRQAPPMPQFQIPAPMQQNQLLAR